MTLRLLFYSFFCVGTSLSPHLNLRAQCNISVTHASGTQTVGCTDVTVTSDGSVAWGPLFCGKSPYWIGPAANGSYTFNFDPAISAAKIGIHGINHVNGGTEEIAFTVNGSFYPITIPGVDDGCAMEAIITPTGTISCGCNFCSCSWNDIIITENMTSLKVEDIITNGSPNGVIFSLMICCPPCTTDAGEINDNAHTACVGTTVNFVPATQTFLDNNDILQYILYINPAAPLSSIVATSNTPSFSFNPATMQPWAIYYIAAIAGNNVNGNVNLLDGCLDISNAITVMWFPLSTVSFSVANPNVCAGACTTITATFTGPAPFTLTYTTPASGPLTQTFPTNIGTFQVCTAANSQPGGLVVQATKVTNTWCTCE